MNISEIIDAILRTSPLPVVALSNISLPKDGTLVPTPSRCKKVFPLGKCQVHYESLAKTDSAALQPCPYGFSTKKIQIDNQSMAMTSLIPVSRNMPLDSKSKRLLKDAPASGISQQNIELVASRLVETAHRVSLLINESDSSHTDALHEVRSLNQTVKVVIERIELALKDKRSALQIETLLHDVVRAGKASELMSFHMDVLDMLANPALMQIAPGRSRGFVLHQIIKKMFVIYKAKADEKKVGLELSGNSFATIKADDRVFYIIPSVFIDNAIKYSEKGDRVEIRVFEGALDNLPSVGFEVISRGPKSTLTEESRLFKQRGRGKAASTVAGGSGVGLYLAGLIAKNQGAKLTVKQRPVSVDKSEWVFRFEMPAYGGSGGRNGNW